MCELEKKALRLLDDAEDEWVCWAGAVMSSTNAQSVCACTREVLVRMADYIWYTLLQKFWLLIVRGELGRQAIILQIMLALAFVPLTR